jgi:hypothetical protein
VDRSDRCLVRGKWLYLVQRLDSALVSSANLLVLKVEVEDISERSYDQFSDFIGYRLFG